jgi:hypothetical protein
MGRVDLSEDSGLDPIAVATFKIEDLQRNDRIDVDPFTEVSEVNYLLCHMLLVDCNQSIIFPYSLNNQNNTK